MNRWPRHDVTRAEDDGQAARVTLSTGERLDADFVVFATGYRADLQAVPYLTHLVGEGILVQNGYPILDESLASTTAGRYIAGFPATQNFGPFFGFVRGAIPTASMIVEDLLART
jgi:FAD-dependent urate hydroxylase